MIRAARDHDLNKVRYHTSMATDKLLHRRTLTKEEELKHSSGARRKVVILVSGRALGRESVTAFRGQKRSVIYSPRILSDFPILPFPVSGTT